MAWGGGSVSGGGSTKGDGSDTRTKWGGGGPGGCLAPSFGAGGGVGSGTGGDGACTTGCCRGGRGTAETDLAGREGRPSRRGEESEAGRENAAIPACEVEWAGISVEAGDWGEPGLVRLESWLERSGVQKRGRDGLRN